MAAFQAAFINEIEKLYKKKKVLVAVILSLVIIIIGQIAILGMRSGFGIRGAGKMDFAVLVLSVVINTILPLFTALVAIDMFSGEFSHNVMRGALTRPVSRFKLFSAKIGAIGVFILANLLVLLILSVLAGVLFNNGTLSGLEVLKTSLAYIMSFFPILVLALLVVLLANFLKSGTSVFFLGILLFLGCKVVGIFFSQYSGLLITGQLEWYNLWLSTSFPGAKVFRQFLIMGGYSIMLFTAAYYLFDKKEF